MRRYDNWVKRILLIAGFVEITVGLSHFAMPHYARQAEGLARLNQDEFNFFTLCVFAVGILLLAFGALTVLFSLKLEPFGEIILYYVLVKSALWLGRIALEVFYPVKIMLFHIGRPTAVVMPLLILEWLLFVLSAVLMLMGEGTDKKAGAANERRRAVG